jgi:hypothetical protein
MADTNKEAAKQKSKKQSKKKTVTTSIAQTSEVVGGSSLSTQSSPLTATGLTDNDQRRLQEMVMLANIEYNKIKNKIIKEKRREIESLDGQIKEFLGPYMLIGYDLNNNPVEIVSANTAAENDALLERFRRVMFKINQNITNSNGDDPFGNSN